MVQAWLLAANLWVRGAGLAKLTPPRTGRTKPPLPGCSLQASLAGAAGQGAYHQGQQGLVGERGCLGGLMVRPWAAGGAGHLRPSGLLAGAAGLGFPWAGGRDDEGRERERQKQRGLPLPL